MPEAGPEEAVSVLGTRGTAWRPETRLYSDGVVIGADGAPVIVPPRSSVSRVPGTGLLEPGRRLPGAAEATPEAVERERAWLAAADVPGRGSPWEEMARTALIDVRTLLYPHGALVAAASPYWRYVWPRDAAFCAVALALSGRRADALRVLRYVAAIREADGTWQARYLPDGSGRVPDDRGTQLDGIGWTLWAAWLLWRTASVSPDDASAATDAEGWADVSPALLGAAEALDAVVDVGTGLPRPSPDYWEKATTDVTLGTAAPLLLGARAGAEVLRGLGAPDAARRCARVASRLGPGIERPFAPHGYPRRRGGGRDAAVAFLLPPFAPAAPRPRASWHRTLAALRLSNGGVRPGEEWTDTATAWTPQLSLFAMTAACLGEPALAGRLLDWLDAHRTRLGALPEKVTDDGRPAAVAPLALTGASVLIALHALDGHAVHMPPT
ncbi:glycoside hydrolase family 15 protein [Nocardiopsis gilva]|uniref:hypothetical protein n=1 Tax=Nocardiopsis gilva TaxID=280236 RepID=UPI0003453A27|nr:hypothetical protein [Nocardiopsis gilva]